MAEFYFDASSMDALERDLEESAARLAVETDKALVEVGLLIKVTAKRVAADAGSHSIPPTVHSIPKPGMVVVTAGSESVPLAVLWDLGNRGRGNRLKPTFKHPVFPRGDRSTWTWVEQKRHPILTRARTLMRKGINERMNAAWDRGLAPLTRE